MLEIEKGIPIPPYESGTKGRMVIYPFPHMEIGDSFLWKGKEGSENIRSKAQAAGKRLGMEFSCRRISSTSIRVWRLR